MSRWEPGLVLGGRFVVRGRLAAGGMAEIYVAEMALARGVRRKVALKRIHPHLAEDPDFVAMFLDEARVASQLAHRGVVALLDAVECGGDLVIVMEYVPGWDLSAVLRAARDRKKDVPLGVAVAIAQSVAETLAYVHTAADANGTPLGIVHRDVTPANLLVGEDGSVRLLDFGVAKAAERATKTATATLKGKFAYMSPEQAQSKAVDARTDLYALGLVLYEMLAGERALQADGDVAALNLARAPKHERVSKKRAVPAKLDDLVAALLAVDPAERPQTGEAIGAALEKARADIGGASAEDVRAFVRAVMDAPARPVQTETASVEKAVGLVPGFGSGKTGGSLGTAATRRAGPAAASVKPLLGGTSLGVPIDPDSVGGSLLAGDVPTGTHAPRRGRTLVLTVAALAVLGAGGWFGLREAGVLPAWARRSDEPRPVTATDPVPAAAAGPAREGFGFLRIASTPAGARIEIDGESIDDVTPAAVQAREGARVVRLALDDYEAATVEGEVHAGEVTRLAPVVLRRVPGSLVVRSTPSGAEVTVGGEVRGTTPLELHDLPREALPVRVALGGHEPFAATAPLDRDAEATIEATLETRTAMGTLDVSSVPWAQVTWRGRVIAESTPATGIRMPAGTHTIVLTHPPRGLTETRRITVREGRRTSVVVRMR